MENADDKLAENLAQIISSLGDNIISRLISMLGLSEQSNIPQLFIMSAEIELSQTISSQFTDVLLEVLMEKDIATPGGDTPMGDDNDIIPTLEQAFRRLLVEPDEVLAHHTFQENFTLMFIGLYASNLPCSIEKFNQVTQMTENAINFLTEAAADKSWARTF